MNQTDRSHISQANFFHGTSSLKNLKTLLADHQFHASSIFLVTDKICREHCLPILYNQVKLLVKARVIEVSGDEEDKSIQSCMEIWSRLTTYCADRNVLIINIGGGMITDLGGFAASTFKRGVSFINVPTTLLAQVDAAVGGKTAINFMGHKNLVGVFQLPMAVFVYPGFLETLPERQIMSGLAEIVKHALIADEGYWKTIVNTNLNRISEVGKLVARSIEIKQEIVRQDPVETGMRKLLNFGHTVGHAIESCSGEEGKQLLHGEAIAIGLVCESYLSYRYAGLGHAVLDEICSYILETFPIYEIESRCFHRLIQLMKNDKKNKGNQIRFSLLKNIGEASFDQSIETDAIIQSFQFYNEKISLIQLEE